MTNRCYGYNAKKSAWFAMPNLTEARQSSAAITHPRFGVVVSGGRTMKRIVGSVDAMGSADLPLHRRRMPQLPRNLSRHCQVMNQPSVTFYYYYTVKKDLDY